MSGRAPMTDAKAAEVLREVNAFLTKHRRYDLVNRLTAALSRPSTQPNAAGMFNLTREVRILLDACQDTWASGRPVAHLDSAMDDTQKALDALDKPVAVERRCEDCGAVEQPGQKGDECPHAHDPHGSCDGRLVAQPAPVRDVTRQEIRQAAYLVLRPYLTMNAAESYANKLDEASGQIVTLQAEVERLEGIEARIATLEAALRPFADVGKGIPAYMLDSDSHDDNFYVGTYRTAARALGETGMFNQCINQIGASRCDQESGHDGRCTYVDM